MKGRKRLGEGKGEVGGGIAPWLLGDRRPCMYATPVRKNT